MNEYPNIFALKYMEEYSNIYLYTRIGQIYFKSERKIVLYQQNDTNKYIHIKNIARV